MFCSFPSSYQFRFSAIHCADAVARTAAEISRLETPVQADAQPPNGMNSVAVPVVNGRTSSTSTKQASQQAKGIMGMFAAKSRDTHKVAKVETKEVPSVSHKVWGRGGGSLHCPRL